MEQYTIVNLIGDIFKYIGKFFGFIGNIFKVVCGFFYNSVELIASIFGVNSIGIKLVIAALYMIALSIIPDLISYYSCRLSKKYRKLKTKEEKKEYCSKHTHFLLNVILNIKNKLSQFKASMIAKKDKSKNNKKENDSKKIGRRNDVIVDDVVNDLSEVPSSNLGVDSIQTTNIEAKNDLVDDDVSDLTVVPEEPVIVVDEEKVEEVKPNIKVLYSSNVIGNMLRKGVVLERKLLSGDRPVLVDFSGKPKEVFTGHLCDEQSGIKFRKMVSGKKIEMFLDNPDLLSNPKLYDDITKEELEKLKELLLSDKNYQTALKNFFTLNDKALTYKKS